MTKLRGTRALITGASSGIGVAFAHELAARGIALVLTARRRDRLEALAEQIRKHHDVEVVVVPLDLAERDAPRALYEATEGSGYLIDFLVNNAGFGTRSNFLEIPWEKTLEEMQLNMIALTELAKRFAIPMVSRRRGHILNVASIGAFLPTPFMATYGAGKAFVRSFSEALDYELEPSGVSVSCLCPGPVATEFMTVAGMPDLGWKKSILMSAERCARIGVRTMLTRRRVVVAGFLNKVAMFLTRFAPRALTTWIAARLL